MNRVSIREQAFNLIAYLLVQLPLIYRITLFDKAFGFFYVGFLLFLPFTISRTYLLLVGFLSGLIVDVFSNTPGIHASACVLIMFLRNFWLQLVHDDTEELSNINYITLKVVGFIAYAFPLIVVHHLVIFILENGGLYLPGQLFTKIFMSSIFSFIIILALNYLIAPKGRRI